VPYRSGTGPPRLAESKSPVPSAAPWPERGYAFDPASRYKLRVTRASGESLDLDIADDVIDHGPTHPGEPLAIFIPENPNQVNFDWPFRGIDHVLVRCGDSGGPTLVIRSCRRVFDQGLTSASDQYGLVVKLSPPPSHPSGR
jgi:hypothetical protein